VILIISLNSYNGFRKHLIEEKYRGLVREIN